MLVILLHQSLLSFGSLFVCWTLIYGKYDYKRCLCFIIKIILIVKNLFYRQKWMHTHRIGIILMHDLPLPKYLHLPNSNDRYHTVQCRQALAALNALLVEWSSFVLIENHSYITFLFE